LVVAHDGFLCVKRNRPYFSLCFIVATLITEVPVLDSYCCITSWTYLTEKGNSVSDNNWGVQYHPYFHSGYFDYNSSWFVLLCKGVNIAYNDTMNHNGYLTLRYNWGVWNHYYLMIRNAWVHQSVSILMCKKLIN